MLPESYTKAMSDQDFQSTFVAISALSIATAGDREAKDISDLRYRMTIEAFERGFSHKKVETLRDLGVKTQRKAYMMA